MNEEIMSGTGDRKKTEIGEVFDDMSSLSFRLQSLTERIEGMLDRVRPEQSRDPIAKESSQESADLLSKLKNNHRKNSNQVNAIDNILSQLEDYI